MTVIDEAGIDVKPRVLGVTRTYHTRHGYGPFPSENMDYLTKYPEKHNKTGRWQGDWRAGPLDITLLDYAVRVNEGIDEVVISHCDREITEYARTPINLPVVGTLQDIDEQERELTQPLTELHGKSELIPVSDTDEMLGIIQDVVEAPIAIKAYGERINQREGE